MKRKNPLQIKVKKKLRIKVRSKLKIKVKKKFRIKVRAKPKNNQGCGTKCVCCAGGYLKNPGDACCTSCEHGGMCAGPRSNPPKFSTKELRKFLSQMRKALQTTLRCKKIPAKKFKAFAEKSRWMLGLG